ncbi:MAG: hypothetical protein ACRDFX_03500 [Chloroflexota bacterium]
MNDTVRKAIEALEAGAAEARSSSSRSVSEARARLHRAIREASSHLDGDPESELPPEPEDIISRLQRQSQDIAEDLRRVERLMHDRTGR